MAALVAVGLGAPAPVAVANDRVSGGTIYVVASADGGPVRQPLAFDAEVVAEVAPGDTRSGFVAPPGADEAWTFIAPRGAEASPGSWVGRMGHFLGDGTVTLPDVTLALLAGFAGDTAGRRLVAAGGDYSLGVAFTRRGGGVVGQPSSVPIHVAPGTGAWTIEDPGCCTGPATWTVLSAPPHDPMPGVAFTLGAAVTAYDAGVVEGDVEFLVTPPSGSPATPLGVAPVAGGTANLVVVDGLPTGSYLITARYLGAGGHAASLSMDGRLVISATSPVATSTTVDVEPVRDLGDDLAYAGTPVTVRVRVTALNGDVPSGRVTVSGTCSGDACTSSWVVLGDLPLAAGEAGLTSSALGPGRWMILAQYVPTGRFEWSSKAAFVDLAPRPDAAAPDVQTVEVQVPVGALTITTPWPSWRPLDIGTLVLDQATSTFVPDRPIVFASAVDPAYGIKITNSRAGASAFTAQVSASDFSGPSGSFSARWANLEDIFALQVPGNALVASDVTVTQLASLSTTAQTFASYGGPRLGTVWLSAMFTLRVPSSTLAGSYTSTLTFTAF